MDLAAEDIEAALTQALADYLGIDAGAPCGDACTGGGMLGQPALGAAFALDEDNGLAAMGIGACVAVSKLPLKVLLHLLIIWGWMVRFVTIAAASFGTVLNIFPVPRPFFAPCEGQPATVQIFRQVGFLAHFRHGCSHPRAFVERRLLTRLIGAFRI